MTKQEKRIIMKAFLFGAMFPFWLALTIFCSCFLFCGKNYTTEQNTTLQITNESSDSVLVYLTLSKQDNRFVQDVNGIFGIKQTGLVGSFYLQSHDTVSYRSTLEFSGNIGFGTQGLNCKDSTWKNGVNIFEFNLNEPQESIDISCVGGVNCIMSADLIGGTTWSATPTYPNVRYIENHGMYANSGLVGVYPYGCTTCIDSAGKQSCQTPAEKPNRERICNPTRPTNQRGGIVC